MTRPPSRRTLALSLTLLFVLALAAAPARALVDYTDTWWAAGGKEPGWGVNFTQQNRFLYGTFYVYGPDGKAVWYTAQMNRVGETEVYSGPVYRVSGTWFGAPVWAGYDISQVGSASFAASAAHRGVLTWNVDGTAMTKNIERLEVAAVPVEGVYIGGLATSYSAGCNNGGASRQAQQFILTRSGGNFVTIDFVDLQSRTQCIMDGQAQQFGRMYFIPSAVYQCQSGVNTSVEISKLQKLDDGIEFAWRANLGGSCVETGRAAGVRQ
jgi:hypothetical protein